MKPIRLADCRAELVPDDIILINPELEDKAAYIYCVWVTNARNPCDQAEACGGHALGPIYAYLSDRDDLHVFGQHVPAVFKDRADAEACNQQVMELEEYVLRHFDADDHPKVEVFIICWMKFDMIHPGKSKSIGTSCAFSKMPGQIDG